MREGLKKRWPPLRWVARKLKASGPALGVQKYVKTQPLQKFGSTFVTAKGLVPGAFENAKCAIGTTAGNDKRNRCWDAFGMVGWVQG